MNKKYELIPSDIIGISAVKALRDFSNVKKGDIGGYIEDEHNLSHEGDCWIYGNARVRENAKVYENAMVYGDALVDGNAEVYGDARVYGYARISGNSWVSGNARVSGNAWVSGNAEVFGNDTVTKNIISMILPKHHITVTDNHVNIGCEQHTLEYWLENYRHIGKDNKYEGCEIELYRYILNGIYIYQKGIKDE